MSIIEFHDVAKEYQLGQLQSLKQTLLNLPKRLAGRELVRRKPFRALDDVNFTIDRGEVIGVIGHNGAGKSTLLKLLANITKPTRGSVTVRGRIAPLIEVGAGFVGDLTGRENIYLNGSILGMPRKLIERKFDEIVAFAEMEEFIDTPVKRYSSGMHVKLAFSVATCMESEILLVDEVLAVGDLAFQRKCFERVESLIHREGRTVLIVSHNIRQVERMCKRVLMLDHGRLIADGDAATICNQFYEQNDAKAKANSLARSKIESTGEVELLSIKLLNGVGPKGDVVTEGTRPVFEVRLKTLSPLPKPVLVFGLHTIDFFYVSTSTSPEGTFPDILPTGEHIIQVAIEAFPFNNGLFSVRLSLDIGEVLKNVFYAENILQFHAFSPALNRARSEAEGIMSLRTQWRRPCDDSEQRQPSYTAVACAPKVP